MTTSPIWATHLLNNINTNINNNNSLEYEVKRIWSTMGDSRISIQVKGLSMVFCCYVPSLIFSFWNIVVKPQINCPHARSDVKMCSWPSEKGGFFVSGLIGITTSEFNIMQQIAPECTTSSQIHDAFNHLCMCNVSKWTTMSQQIYTAWSQCL